MSTTPLLAAHALAIGHPRRTVGENINLQLAGGEVLCLLGPNGSGKTTLFRTLLGLLPARDGQIEVAGQPLARWSRSQLASKLAYVPQNPALPFAFSLEEVVLMGRIAHGSPFRQPSRQDRALAAEALHSLGIAHLAERACTEVSGGERQLALIARALAQQAAVLILDEPTSSLDFGNQLRVLDCLSSLRARGLAILLSTHQPEHALRIADRILFLKQGQLIASGGRELITPAALARLYDSDEALIAAGLGMHMP